MIKFVGFILILVVAAFSYSAFFNKDVRKDCQEYAVLLGMEGDKALKNMKLSKGDRKKLAKKLKKCKKQLGEHGTQFKELISDLISDKK